ncbi:GntR family transcriptional regulator [Streptomyces sp. NPDC006326]|uniref:GntR family transcriptional regulator n=1 Tax=Streptomyces sp. NPDC006326 TaxID=3156752 RepID=UPI00339FC591
MSSHTPRYIQIADALRNKILRGELQPGARVPSENEIREQWSVSGITARAALSALRNEGLIEGVRGKGSYVRNKSRLVRLAPQRWFRAGTTAPRPTFSLEAERAGQNVSVERSTRETQASAEIAERLDISSGDAVSETAYFIVMDSKPVSSGVSWEPLSLTAGTAIASPTEGPHAALGIVGRFDQIGIPVDEVEEVLDCRMPSSAEVQSLQMPAQGTPIVAVQQTWRAQGRPVCTADVVFPADRYEFRYRMDIK